MHNYIHTGSIHIQGASGHPLITLLPSTIEAMRAFQGLYSEVNVTTIVNEAIMEALDERDEQIRKLHTAAENM